ncbi:MAG: response regulator [bacterium]
MLVVEDEQLLRSSMVRCLRRLPGVEVSEASTLAEARARVAERVPTLVLSDVSLPDGEGIELLQTLDQGGLRVPVLFVTAILGRLRDRLPDRPCIEVLEKPLPLSVLRERVTHALARAKHAGGQACDDAPPWDDRLELDCCL